MQESRAHPRAPIELKVTYQRMNAFIADYTRDISKGGIFVKTEVPLPVGSELEFQVTLPRRPEALRLRGRVAWVAYNRAEAEPAASPGAPPRPPLSGMGVQFTWTEEAARQAFEQTVEELMVETLGKELYAKLREPRGP